MQQAMFEQDGGKVRVDEHSVSEFVKDILARICKEHNGAYLKLREPVARYERTVEFWKRVCTFSSRAAIQLFEGTGQIFQSTQSAGADSPIRSARGTSSPGKGSNPLLFRTSTKRSMSRSVLSIKYRPAYTWEQSRPSQGRSCWQPSNRFTLA